MSVQWSIKRASGRLSWIDAVEQSTIMALQPKRRRTRLDPADRRKQLLTCSLAVFAEHGIARATHSQVAAKAGMSVSAVYSYFRTREDLTKATLAEVESYLDRIFEETRAKGLPPYETLLEMGRIFSEGAKSEPDRIRVLLDWSTAVGLDVWPAYLAMLEKLEGNVESILEDAVCRGCSPKHLDTRTAARMFVGGGYTVGLMQCANVDSNDVDRFVVQLAHAVMGVSERFEPAR